MIATAGVASVACGFVERVPAGAPDHELNALLLAVRRGCRVSFARLYVLTSKRLFGIVLRINRDQGDAEEVLQDVYVKVWQRSAQFDVDRGQAMPWLAAIARFAAISSLRRRTRRPQRGFEPGADEDDPYASLPSAETEPLDAIVRARSAEAVQSALRALSSDQRESLVLAFYEGLSHAEIAQRLGRPIGTVKSWLRRSFALLQPILAEHR